MFFIYIVFMKNEDLNIESRDKVVRSLIRMLTCKLDSNEFNHFIGKPLNAKGLYSLYYCEFVLINFREHAFKQFITYINDIYKILGKENIHLKMDSRYSFQVSKVTFEIGLQKTWDCEAVIGYLRMRGVLDNDI